MKMMKERTFESREDKFVSYASVIPPNFEKMEQLLDEGVDINAYCSFDRELDSTLLSEVVVYQYTHYLNSIYSKDSEKAFDEESRHRDHRKLIWQESSVKHPEIADHLMSVIDFFFCHGYDPYLFGGQFSKICIDHLLYFYCEKTLFPLAMRFLDFDISEEHRLPLLEHIGAEESYARCVDKDPVKEHILFTLGEIALSSFEGRNFRDIRFYDAAVGKRIDRVLLYGSLDSKRPPFYSEACDGETVHNRFDLPLILDCEGLALYLEPQLNLWINPDIDLKNTDLLTDVSSSFKKLIGARINNIDLAIRTIDKGFAPSFNESLIRLNLDNSCRLIFTNKALASKPKGTAPSFEIVEEDE
ncbi:MAG: hypothetical protein Q3993_06235 [Filifactor alocis]|nr:hypothetical protein [Filifactor alocis]